MLTHKLLLPLVATLLLATGAARATEPSSPKRSPSKFFVDIFDKKANVKLPRVRVDLRSPASVKAALSNPLISTKGGQDGCSLTFAFNISTGYAVSCESDAATTASRANAWGDCEVNDEKHPLGFQFIALREGGPNWELWAWCVME